MRRDERGRLVIKVPVVAKTTYRGRPGLDHEVHLRQDAGKGWVLVIDGTPGQWYLTTLLHLDDRAPFPVPIDDVLPIDDGARWYLTNTIEVLRAAFDLLLGGVSSAPLFVP